MKKWFIGFLLIIVVLVAILLVNVIRYDSRQMTATTPVTDIKIDENRAAGHLSEAIRFKTISYQDPSKFDREEFLAFHRFIKETYPNIHQTLKRETISDLSLLYTWKGKQPDLKPIILTAHMDVVPAGLKNKDQWTAPPFSGNIADGYIWGRGALDDKASLIGIMEAVETLLGQGFTPDRTVYLAFGHDEEMGGLNGAVKIAELFKSRGVKAEWLLDESGLVLTGVLPGLSAPAALVGISEKGYMTLELKVEQPGGHSSMPPSETTIGILAGAITRLEKNQFPTHFKGTSMELMFDYLGPEMDFGMKFLFANQWLFEPLIKMELLKAESTAAALRTTIAPTIIQAGTKENVLPSEAVARVNFRLMPGDKKDDVIAHVKAAIDDPRVAVTLLRPERTFQASNVSDVESAGFKNLECTIRQVFPDAFVGPYLVLGGTDARHYDTVSDCSLRFLPLRQDAKDLSRIHGVNERVGVSNFAETIEFYIQLIRNANSSQPLPCQ